MCVVISVCVWVIVDVHFHMYPYIHTHMHPHVLNNPKKTPKHHPNTPQTHSIRAPGGDSLPLLQSMALLYSQQGRYDMALTILLRLRDPLVFDFVKKHALLTSVARYKLVDIFC